MSNEEPGISGKQYIDAVSVGLSDGISSDNDVDNICLQTGEEFSAEFLRDRVALRRFPVITDADQRLPNRLDVSIKDNNYELVYEDLKHVLGLRRTDSDSNSDLSEIAFARGYVAEVDNRAHPNNLNRYQCEHGGFRQASGTFCRQLSGKFSEGNGCDEVNSGPNTPSIYVFESPHSCHPHGSVFSEDSFYKKIKFLCSFGGRILPRPNDGKLRYVGGETRIISIRKNISWEELMRKTSAICSQTHVIKYQLPGEDLDALISVCSNEDLHHMIEEYEELERAGGSQRLRIFLIPSNECESPSSNEARVNQPSDADYHYVVAVNGMLDPSPRKNSNGLSLASHTSQFGNTSDYNSPRFHRDSCHSSTSAFASEMKDCTPTSPNLGGILPKPGPQFLTALAGKSFNQMSPLSPICVQPKDPKISNVQLFMDKPYNAINESTTPFVMEKVPHDNSLYVDNTNYVDPAAYCNNLAQGHTRVNYHPNNQYIVESDQIRKPGENLHLHRWNNSNEFVSSAVCSLTDMIFERPLVTNEGSYHFNKIVSHPHESSSLFSESDVREGSQYRMLHAHSDSTLKENDENYKVHLHFPLSVERDNLPSLKNSSSLEECSIQPGRIIDRKEHLAKYQNLPIFGMIDSFQRVSEIGKESLQHADKSNDFFDTNVGAMSRVNAIDLKHLQYIYSPHGVCSSSPDLQSSESTASFISLESARNLRGQPHGLPLDRTASEFSMRSQNSSIESTRNLRGQPHGLPLDRTASEFSMRSQNSSMYHQYAMLETKDSQQLLPGSFVLQPIESQTDKESIPLISYKDMGSSPIREVVIPVEDPAYYLLQKEENIVIKNQSSEYINEFCVNKPVPESVAVVKGPMDYISSGIQSCLKVEPTSPEKEGIECDNPEAESKHAKSDRGNFNFNKPTDDRATAETEAEIYGLQNIENDDLEELQELGSGTFGTVYHGKWRGTDVAIKRIKSSCFSDRLSEQERLTKDFWREAQILSTLHHPNVVAFYGVVPDGPGGTLATVTEYMVHGSLRNVLMKKEKVLDRRKRLLIAMDAAFGMEYLHLKNIVHFDLKCDNLLVNLGDPERPVCKVGDFGLSRIKCNTLVSGGVRGTLPWMAPELLDGNSCRVSEKVDIFSFGIAMWEILTGEEPYANMHCGAIIGGIVNNTLRPPIPKRCDFEWKKLMEECWSPDPAARPTFTEVKNRLRNMSAALLKRRHNIGNR
ncbi:phosphorylation protein [Spatholobus suberectus]|nr:phosphorylation protein [Spatholobus suberectus]